MYIDLWHGKCRDAFFETPGNLDRKPAFTLKAPYDNFVQVLRGEMAPMQALLTRKLGVQGNMAVLMRNVPTVLEFVRCAREVTSKVSHKLEHFMTDIPHTIPLRSSPNGRPVGTPMACTIPISIRRDQSITPSPCCHIPRAICTSGTGMP